MGTRTEAKLARIDAGHEWTEGQPHSRGGTHITRSSECSYCGLLRRWVTDPQNGIEDLTTFPGYAAIRDVPDSCEEV